MSETSLEAGLVGWWPLHDESGEAIDLSGLGNHGTATGVIRNLSGVGGLTGTYFDGTDDYIEIPKSGLPDLPEYTFSIWFNKHAHNSSYDRLWEVGGWHSANSMWGGVMDTGEIRFRVDDSTSNNRAGTESSYHLNEWYHAVFTYDGLYFRLYLNGELVEEQSTDYDFNIVNDVPLYIGNNNTGTGNVFQGQLCDARVYNRALSEAEVRALYRQGGQAGPPTDGVARYAFEDSSSSSTAVDSWGSHGGTISGATYTSVAERGGSALSFNGSSDYVNLPTGILPSTGPFTITAWTKTDVVDSGGSFWADMRGDTRVVIGENQNSPGLFSYWIDGTWYNTNETIADGKWHHHAVTSDGSTAYAYFDGELVHTTSHTMASGAQSSSAIGGRYDGGSRYWNGLLDGVRMYDRRLHGWEIGAIARGEYDLVHPPNTGTAYYPFDGDATDAWGSHNGTTTGGVSWLSGVRGQGIDLDGTDDAVDLPTLGISGSEPHTISVWFRTDSPSVGQTLYYQGDRATDSQIDFIYQGGTPQMNFSWYGNDLTYGISLTANTWYHIVGTYDGTTRRLYINGEIVASDQPSAPAIVNDQCSIGYRRQTGGQYCDGTIDDVRIFQRGLEPWEIAQLYRYGTRGADLRARTVIQ